MAKPARPLQAVRMTPDHTDAVHARQPLRRSRGDRLVLGICAGIARSLDLSPLAVRLAAVVLAAVAFPLLLAGYAVAAAIVPRDDGRVLLGGTPADRRETLLGWSLVAAVLVWFAGAGFRLEDLVWPGLSSFGIFAAAVAALALLAHNQRREAEGAAASPVSPTPTTTQVPAMPSSPLSPSDAPEAPTIPFDDAPTVTQPPVPPPPRGLSLGTIGAGVALIAGAIAFLLDAVDAIDVDAADVAVGLSAAAALAAAAAIAGAVAQRRGVIALLAIAALLGSASAGVGLVADELDDGIGFRTERPATAAAIPDTYRLGVGELDIDLRDTQLPAGATTVRASVRVGDLTVLVPRGVRVESIGPTTVDGVARVNGALPEPGAGKRERQAQTRAQKTIRIDADVREGDADVVAVGR
jgi:phage shock protein PspC (stress-responsive transcriptional regulator)